MTEQNDWIEWEGGECPVDGSVLVEAKLRCGYVETRNEENFNWKHGLGPFAYEGDDDIIAYRVVSA